MFTQGKLKISGVLNSTFLKRTKIVLYGIIISQVIAFATSFVITSYFRPEDLGILGTLSALISIIAGTLSFRLEIAVIQSSEADSVDVFFKSTCLSILISTIFCLLCFYLPWDFARKITDHFFTFLFWCWGYFLFFNSKQLTFKFNQLKDASLGLIWRNAFTFVFQLLSGLLNPSASLLLVGRVAGDYVGAFSHLWKYFKEFKFRKFISGWKKFILSHKDFLLYMTPHHLCIALSNNIIIFYLDNSYGLAIVGFFSLAQRLIQAPLEMIGSTMFNVTIQRYGELKHNINQLQSFYVKVVFFSFMVATFLGATIFFSIDHIIPLLGSKWLPASDMVKSLVPYFMSTLFITPTTNLLRFIDKSRLQLIIEIVELAIKIGFLGLPIFANSNEMVLSYGLITFLLSILKTMFVFKLIHKKN